MAIDNKSVEFFKNIIERKSFKDELVKQKVIVNKLNNGVEARFDRAMETEEAEDGWMRSIESLAKKFRIPEHLTDLLEYYYWHGNCEEFIEAMEKEPLLHVYGASLRLRGKEVGDTARITVFPGATMSNVITLIRKSWPLIEAKFAIMPADHKLSKRIKTKPMRERNKKVKTLVDMRILKSDGNFSEKRLGEFFAQNPPKSGVSYREKLNSLGFNLPKSPEARAKIYKSLKNLENS